jgi:UDP-glucose:(heptosyl)LPS alpha-1,3-glucosyltransferase
MKLALIRRKFSAVGGAELYLQRLLAALSGHGHELHVFSEKWMGPPEGVQLHAVSSGGWRHERPRRFAEAVLSEIEGNRFDCVFSLERTLRQDVYRAGDGVHRAWLKQRRRFAPGWKKPFTGASAFHREMMKLEARTFDPANTRLVIVNSEMVRREILEYFRFPAERIRLVRNGVDVPRFQKGDRARTRARFGVRDDEPLILFVGSGWERKGLPQLLAAFRRLPVSLRAKLLVAGKGKRPFFQPRNVIWAGPMPDVENAYAAADLFVFLPIYEPASNVVTEALAAGLPVVTSVFNGAAEGIEKGVNGSVVADPSDPQSVLAAMQPWLERRTRLAPADPSLFGIERNVRETVAVLEEAARMS